MGLCASTKIPTNAESKAIDKDLENVRQQEEKIHKLLLLGAGDSGKSTLFKQITQTYGKGFSPQDFKEYIGRVRDNATASINVLAKNCQAVGCLDQVGDDVLPLVDQLIKTVWADEGIKNTFNLRSKFQIQDSAYHFLDRIEEISSEDYTPNFQDVLRCRIATTGIHHIQFEIKKAKFRMYDVGGQRSERKKWINCFDSVTAVLFVASISEFDQMLYEDETVNRMEEAMKLFDYISNHQAFQKVNMMLFLNKMDLLEEKLNAGVQFSDFFPDYPGENTFEPVKDYIKDMFVARVEEGKDVYVHVTKATDTDMIERVFAPVKDHIIKSMLGGFGLL